jgi:hypothetical protein
MDKENFIPSTPLVGLQGQLNTIRSEIFTTNVNLQGIGRLIQSDSLQDQRKLLEEREQEKKLLELKIRQGQENQLEQKVSTSLRSPLISTEKKLNSTFANITKALGTLFGFFGIKVIQGIQSSAKLGIGALSGIRNLLKGSFGFITSTLGTLSRGFTSILSGIGGITGKVIKSLSALAASPFKGIADLVKSLLSGIRSAAPVAAAGAGVSGLGSLLLKALGIGARTSTAIDAVTNFQEGNYAESAINAAATFAPFSLPSIALSGMKATGNELDLSNINFSEIANSASSGFSNLMEYGSNFLSGSGLNFDFLNNPAPEVKGTVEEGSRSVQPQSPIDSTLDSIPSSVPQSPIDSTLDSIPSSVPQSPMIPTAASPSTSPKAEPQSPVIPPPTPEMVNKFQIAFDNRDKAVARGRIESAWKNMSPVEQQQAKKWVESKGYSWSVMRLPDPVQMQSPSGPQSLEVVPFRPQSTPQPNLGSLPEPPPDVVVLENNKDKPSSVIGRDSQTLTDVPLIPSGNPDNFYTLYSQVNYNVVF